MNQQEPYLTGEPIPPHLRDDDVVSGSPLNPRHPSSAAYEGETFTKAELEAAVHEAYVNAQRAVAAIDLRMTWGDYNRGQQRMQEDAVRAIRTAAEEVGK